MVFILTAGELQWEVDPPCGDEGPDGVTPEQWDRAQALAVEWVWALSGRRYGVVEVDYRPEWTIPIRRDRCWPTADFLGYMPSLFTGSRPLTNAPLPGPVVQVTGVMVNGSAVSSGAYIVQRGQLVRTDGGVWPTYQDTTKPLTDDGTWQISYTRGLPVPAGGQWAVGVLACELAKGMCSSDGKCRLPSNTISVARNGTNISLDAKQLQKAFTTLTEVDQWCRQVNPNGQQQAPFVWSPDVDPDRLPPIPTSV